MRVALFVPCYVDQLRPQVGIAALALLEAQGIDVEVPRDVACCGQPFLTAGAETQARALAHRFARRLARVDHVVVPSGSCAATLRRHLARLVPGPDAAALAARCHELCEFLVGVCGVEGVGGRLHARVGWHASCHALRELRLGTPSETRETPRRDPARTLLASVEGLELVPLRRADECCGFGGVFAVEEEAVSIRMGRDRLADHREARAEIVSASDVSCLLHLEGLAHRDGVPLRMLHVAELLALREQP